MDETMKKLTKKRFTLVELIIVIIVIAILAGLAAPKFMGVQRDAKVAAFKNDLDVLTTVETLVSAKSESAATQYGQDTTGTAVTVPAASDLDAALRTAFNLSASDVLPVIMPLDQSVYSANMGKAVKTGDLGDYFVVTDGANAGTIVYIPDTATCNDGVEDGDGVEWFGLNISK